MVVQITLLCLGIGSVVAVIKEDRRENWIGELRKKGDLVSWMIFYDFFLTYIINAYVSLHTRKYRIIY